VLRAELEGFVKGMKRRSGHAGILTFLKFLLGFVTIGSM